MKIHYVNNKYSIELEETEVDENMTVGELRQHMAALYFANPEEIKLSEKKYVQGNSYYKELKYDMLTLKSLDFTPQSLVLVESTKGKILEKPVVETQTEADQIVSIVKQQLKSQGININ
ncbi:hypothetical protein ENUP19_0068G0004 [Entamoeba nuttalli]|uniref:Ubiquitin-like domain-containing protein n=1 Tax=Entamoeba nuttalli TaxID=412467 RepID=A0ABQ0DE77_9EUKA